MHYFLFLRLSGFYAKALEQADSRLSAKPLVVHRNKRVIDVNRIAQRRQIYLGMLLAEAKAILQEASFIAWEEEPFRDAQMQWLDVCTDYSDVIEPDEQHSAWVDLSLHPDPASLSQQIVLRIRDVTGLQVIHGSGSSKWIAALASRVSHAKAQSRQRDTAVKAIDFLATLKTRFLTPVDPEHRARLEFLGYMTIGEVATIPLSILQSQFGDAATHIMMCARGGYFEPVEALYPPNSISERVPFEGSVDDLQTLDLALRELALALSRRLSKEDKQGKELVVCIEFEGCRFATWKRKFTKPIQNYASALSSLRLLLTPPPEEPIMAIRARIENVTESKRVQQELTGRTTSVDRECGVMAAFQHVRTVFGDTAIIAGGEIVEPRRKQVLRVWKDATGWT